MKTMIAFLLLSSFTYAATEVKGHQQNGKYVAPHQRSAPDKSKTNNYSTKGNRNPYTGKKGTKTPSTPPTPRKK